MILYLDTSDIFKLYLQETDSFRVETNVLFADRLASSALSYVEMRSALAKAMRDHRFSETPLLTASDVYHAVVQQFNHGWDSLVRVSSSQTILRSAGAFAEAHGLRAGDAVHLASAVSLRSTSADEIRFSVADSQLKSAAIAEGFVVV